MRLARKTVGRNGQKIGDATFAWQPSSVLIRSVLTNLTRIKNNKGGIFFPNTNNIFDNVVNACLYFKDPNTGAIIQKMKTPYKKAHRVGGTLPVNCFIIWVQLRFTFQGFGLKLFSCFESNTCKDWNNRESWETFESLHNFM